MFKEVNSAVIDLNRQRALRTRTRGCRNRVPQPYFGFPISQIAACAGLNPDLTCNVAAPVNAAYLRPLADRDDEAMAGIMAEASFGASPSESGVDYQQCLVDARRMLTEPAYCRTFEV
jgi:hypothetical protein